MAYGQCRNPWNWEDIRAIPKDFKLLKIIQKLELFAHLTVEEAQVVLSLSERKT